MKDSLGVERCFKELRDFLRVERFLWELKDFLRVDCISVKEVVYLHRVGYGSRSKGTVDFNLDIDYLIKHRKNE